MCVYMYSLVVANHVCTSFDFGKFYMKYQREKVEDISSHLLISTFVCDDL
jgi:hypothetical protein